jgi:hypothetical protein
MRQFGRRKESASPSLGQGESRLGIRRSVATQAWPAGPARAQAVK